MNKCVNLILSAGYSTRMRGADKLLEKIDGVSQICRIAKAAAENGDSGLYSTSPGKIQKIFLNKRNTGMGASIAEGIKYIQDNETNVTGIIIIPADMPLIDSKTIKAFFKAHSKFPESIIQAADDNGSGHPVLFPLNYFNDLMMLKNETGGKKIINTAKNTKVLKLEGSIATLDLDTPEDWENWRNK